MIALKCLYRTIMHVKVNGLDTQVVERERGEKESRSRSSNGESSRPPPPPPSESNAISFLLHAVSSIYNTSDGD